jgi:hypothetical protein
MGQSGLWKKDDENGSTRCMSNPSSWRWRIHHIPPSCSSTRFPVEISINTRERSSTTRISFLPRTCSVGVAYSSEKTVAERGPATLNPDTETQNLLQSRRRRGKRVNDRTKDGKEARQECDIQRWVRRLAVHEERWIEVRPLKLRSHISSLGHLVGRVIKKNSAQ